MEEQEIKIDGKTIVMASCYSFDPVRRLSDMVPLLWSISFLRNGHSFKG